jgi:arylsulfatase A
MKNILKIALTLYAGLILPNNTIAQSAPPNIVFIMADDLGFDDLGVYGATTSTPNIDQLANQGMRFVNYHTAGAVCSPTRASIMTGHFPLKFGITRAFGDLDVRGIPPKYKLLPQLLKEKGYTTGHFGKWHLGRSEEQYRPHTRGFDSTYEWAANDENSYFDFFISENGGSYNVISNDVYFPRYITDRAIEFIQANANKRFFLNLWHFTPHQPVHIPPGFDNTSHGYSLATQRGKLQAMVTRLDELVGEVLQALDAAGISNNTMVVFTSDNGAQRAVVATSSALRGAKEELFQGGIKVPLIIRWPAKVIAGSVNDSTLVSTDLFATLLKIGEATPPTGIPAKSFLKSLTAGANTPRNDYLYWEIDSGRGPNSATSGTDPNYAVRHKELKFLFQDNQEYLFNLQTDPGEQTNLVTQLPKKAATLKKERAKWRRAYSRTVSKIKVSKGKVQSTPNQLSFNKVLGTAKLSNQYTARVGSGDLTIAFSLRMSATNGERVIFKNDGFFLRTVNRRLLLTVTDMDDNQINLTGPKLVKDKWYRIVVTTFGWRAGSTTARLFVNGNNFGEQTDLRFVVKSSNGPLVFGNDNLNPASAKSLLGTLRNLRLHTISFSNADIAADKKEFPNK